MLGTRPIALVTALGLGFWAVPVRAEPNVMVWPATADAPVGEAEAALRSRGVPVVPWVGARDVVAQHRAARAQADRERRTQVEAALAAAQQRFLELEFDAMLQVLAAAESDAVALAEPEGCAGLWELEFRRGLGHGARGGPTDDVDAQARYELALALDPDRRPLGELYGPDVTARFLDAVHARSERMARPVALRVQPADARVEIDCRPHPTSEPSLRPGLHAVRVRAPGFAPWSAVVDLRDRDALDVTLTALPSDDAPARRLGLSTPSDAVSDDSASAYRAVLSVAHALGADAVLVVSAGVDTTRARVWGRDGMGAAVERGSWPATVEAAMGLLEHDGRLASVAPDVAGGDGGPGRGGSTPGRKPVLRTWWFWTLVGSVAVGGAAVGLGLGLRQQAPPGRLVIVAR